MFNNFEIKKEGDIVKEQVNYGLATAEQIINELPEADLDKMGGMRELLNRTKINIADSLAKYGFVDYAKKISNLDTNSFSDFWQFKLTLNSLI
jgi:hypothetical protein